VIKRREGARRLWWGSQRLLCRSRHAREGQAHLAKISAFAAPGPCTPVAEDTMGYWFMIPLAWVRVVPSRRRALSEEQRRAIGPV
jgi:hypothetical protein